MAGRRMTRRGGRGVPPGGIARQGQRYWSNRGTSRGKRSGVPWHLHGKASGFYVCVARVRPHLGKGAEGYCSNRGLEATGRRPGSGTRRGGRG